MSELRKWEDLEFDCIVNICEKLDVESLLLVPLVCKSWYKASLSPSCWQHINISAAGEFFINDDDDDEETLSPFVERFIDSYQINNFSVDGLIDLISSRGNIRSLSLSIDSRVSWDLPLRTKIRSKELKYCRKRNWKWNVVRKLRGKLTHLVELRLGSNFPEDFYDILMAEIGQNCENFNSLIISNAQFTVPYAEAITWNLPNIKKLSLKCCFLGRKSLRTILWNCHKLEYLDISEFTHESDLGEEKFGQLTSPIKTFNLAGSRPFAPKPPR